MEERFVYLCNSILNFIFSPPVNYTSIQSILRHYLGTETTISQEQFKYIECKVMFFIESYECTKLSILYLDLFLSI